MNWLPHYDIDEPYPESDGQPMAENTEQYDWLVKIKENLEIIFADRPDVFIAGDLFWYPSPDRRVVGPLAPDVMVVLGRPKGRRGSYRQWEEEGIAPQVVFEILSPANSLTEMKGKRDYYDTYGVQEYYVYDPEDNRLEVWLRQGGRLQAITHLSGWVSPLLGVRFALDHDTMHLYAPSGQPFLNSVELNRRAEQAHQRAEQAHQRAEQERQRAEHERDRSERLAAQLRALGVEPDEP